MDNGDMQSEINDILLSGLDKLSIKTKGTNSPPDIEWIISVAAWEPDRSTASHPVSEAVGDPQVVMSSQRVWQRQETNCELELDGHRVSSCHVRHVCSSQLSA